MESLKAGIIGCGPRSYGHAAAARQAGVLDLQYACDIRQDRMEKAAAEWGLLCWEKKQERATNPCFSF